MSVIDDVLGKEPEQRTAEFCTKADLRSQWGEAKQREKRARIQADARPKDQAAQAELANAEEALADLRKAIGGELLRFTFAPISREDFDTLKGQHRPTEKDRTEARKEGRQPPEWGDSFFPALVAAACIKLEGPSGVQDGISYEDAVRLFQSDRWNEGERNELFNTALAAYSLRTSMDGVSLGND